MSLQAIREMRMNRAKPSGVLSVVIGRVGPLHRGDPEVIELLPGCNPELMDWRPTVGLWMNFYHLDTDPKVMNAAFESALKAGAKVMGYAHRDAVGALCDFSTADDEKKLERLLWQGLEILCK